MDDLELDANPVLTVDEAVSDADIIVTATNSPKPVLFPKHLRLGVLVNAMGIRTEIAPEALARCVVVGDGRDEALHDGKFSVALGAGVVSETDLGPDLGELLDGVELPGSPEERVTMFDSSGVAIQDVTCARFVWERADALDVGTVVDLGLENSP
jgi:alanine dehydrogenase